MKGGKTMEMTEHGLTKLHKYKEIKKEVLKHLHELFEEEVEDTWEDVHEHLAYALKHGTCKDAAKAIMLTSKWVWANCEIKETE